MSGSRDRHGSKWAFAVSGASRGMATDLLSGIPVQRAGSADSWPLRPFTDRPRLRDAYPLTDAAEVRAGRELLGELGDDSTDDFAADWVALLEE